MFKQPVVSISSPDQLLTFLALLSAGRQCAAADCCGWPLPALSVRCPLQLFLVWFLTSSLSTLPAGGPGSWALLFPSERTDHVSYLRPLTLELHSLIFIIWGFSGMPSHCTLSFNTKLLLLPYGLGTFVRNLASL